MAAKHRVAFGLALLMVVALPVSGSGAGEARSPDRTVGLGDSASTPQALPPPSKPWPAPVGHRQPRAADPPAHLPKTASDLAQERRDRELDRRLQICRRC